MKAKRLNPNDPHGYFPYCYKFIDTPNLKGLVLDLYWGNLEAFRQLRDSKELGRIQAVNCTICCLKAVQILHDKIGIVHRDVKPHNILVGSKRGFDMGHLENLKVKDIPIRAVVTDFGLIRKFTSKGQRIPARAHVSFCGTINFAPLSALRSMECSDSDDYFSVLLSIMNCSLKNGLPWINQRDIAKHILMRETLDYTSMANDHGKDVREVYQKIYDYLKNLSYEDQSDFEMILDNFYRLRLAIKSVNKR